MKIGPKILLGVLVLWSMGLAGCQPAKPKATPTPELDSMQAASTLFARASPTPPVTPSPTPVDDLELELNRTIAWMEQAVLAGDYDRYMSYVWDGDPVFYFEHSRWARDWQEHPLSRFELTLNTIQSVTPDTATARMTTLWGQRDTIDAGGTTLTVVFFRKGDTWLLGGESWQTLETEGIRLYYFVNEITDNSSQARDVEEVLPAIYTLVTREFGFTPEALAHIKIYPLAGALQTWTRLSQLDITTWNEPGESIKVTLGPFDIPPEAELLAREYTRFVLFEMSGGTHGGFPWWLEEGIAGYGGSLFLNASQRNRRIRALDVQTETGASRLWAWDDLETVPDVHGEERDFVLNQTFSLVFFVTETYGPEARNAWIEAIAGGAAVGRAAEEHLGVTLETLDAAWREWLHTRQ